VIEQQSKGRDPAAIRFDLSTVGAPARLPWPAAMAILAGLSVALWSLLAVLASSLGLL
jgi:hypothetical protein